MKCEIETKESFKFTSAIIWVGLSQIIIYSFGLITLPILTKAFGTELYGIWSQIMVTVGLLNPILTLHLGAAAVRYLSAEKDIKKISVNFSNMLSTILLITITIIIVSALFRSNLAVILFQNINYSLLIILMFILASTGAIISFMICYLRARGKIKALSIFNILCTLIKIIILSVLVIFNFSLETIVLSWILVESIFIISLFILIIKKIGFRLPNFSNLSNYLTFSVPQVPSGTLLWIIDSSDRYLITSFLGLSQTGIYSVSYSLGSLMSFFYVPLSFVVFPLISSYWENNEVNNVKTYLEYSTKIFLALAIPGAMIIYNLSFPLLNVLTTSKFSVSSSLILLIAIGTIFLGIYQINFYIICLIEKTKYVPFIIGISAFLNIILNIILIPKLGIMGAAISTIISYAILATIVLSWAKMEINYNLDYLFIFKIIVSSLLMTFIINFITISNSLEIILVAITGCILYIIFLFIFRTFSVSERKMMYALLYKLKIRILNFNKPKSKIIYK